MKPYLGLCAAVLSALALAGCGGYRWTGSVPASVRTVSVPTFRNESNITELGGVMTTQLLREFQREGTFSIKSTGNAALEIQGVVKKAGLGGGFRDRRHGLRSYSAACDAIVHVSVIDKRQGRILVDNRPYTAHTTLVVSEDILTAERDASGRMAEDLARQVVDDVLNLKFEEDKK